MKSPLPALVQSPEGAFRGEVLWFSLGVAILRCEAALPQASSYLVAVTLPEDPEPVEMMMTVERSRPLDDSTLHATRCSVFLPGDWSRLKAVVRKLSPATPRSRARSPGSAPSVSRSSSGGARATRLSRLRAPLPSSWSRRTPTSAELPVQPAAPVAPEAPLPSAPPGDPISASLEQGKPPRLLVNLATHSVLERAVKVQGELLYLFVAGLPELWPGDEVSVRLRLPEDQVLALRGKVRRWTGECMTLELTPPDRSCSDELMQSLSGQSAPTSGPPLPSWLDERSGTRLDGGPHLSLSTPRSGPPVLRIWYPTWALMRGKVSLSGLRATFHLPAQPSLALGTSVQTILMLPDGQTETALAEVTTATDTELTLGVWPAPEALLKVLATSGPRLIDPTDAPMPGQLRGRTPRKTW